MPRLLKSVHFLIFTSGFVSYLFAVPHNTAAQTSAQVHSVTNPQISAIQAEKAKRSPAQEKMSSQLLDALKQNTTGSVVSGATSLRAQPLTYTSDGDVVVDIKATVSDELISAIQKLGGKIINKFPEYHSVRASMPLENIEKLAKRSDVQHVTQEIKARTNATVALEGDIAHAANRARANFGISGAGVTVGVVSDSIDDGYDALKNAYDSAAMDQTKLSILPDQDGFGYENIRGEGLAMAEIIHALAPDAHIIFATGFGGPPQMATNIKELAKEGCAIIVDDITYNNESPFQDGPISQAVNDVSSLGVLYFSSARNSGSQKHGTSGTWEGDFHDGGPAAAQYNVSGGTGRIHVFETAKGITLNTADKATPADRVDLFWDDPLGASKNDYDLFVVNKKGDVVRSSTTSPTGMQDPYQSVDVLRPGESIVVVKASGSDDRFLHLDTGRAVLRYSTDGSVRGHNASGAVNAFSVAAKQVPSPMATFRANPSDSVDGFSSDGPRRIFFDTNGTPLTPGNLSSSGGVVLKKPDITAADGITTTLPGLNPFKGTSAAAPHAAGIAALLLSCNPKPTPNQVRRALETSALAIDGSVPNMNAGYGIVMANIAAQSLCSAVQSSPGVRPVEANESRNKQ